MSAFEAKADILDAPCKCPLMTPEAEFNERHALKEFRRIDVFGLV
jgi:hypothetical protein